MPFLVPFYDIINQQSIDLQWTGDSLLFKLEAITRDGHESADRFYATVAGFEYTMYQVFSGLGDLGLLVEHLYDDRDEVNAPPTIFDNDIFAGFRFAANDQQSSAFLFGVVTDLEESEVFLFSEISSRIWDNFLLEFESRWFLSTEENSFANAFERDGYFSISLSYFL